MVGTLSGLAALITFIWGVSRISLSEGLSWVSFPKPGIREGLWLSTAYSLVPELAFLSKGFFPNLQLSQGAAEVGWEDLSRILPPFSL